MFTWFRKVLRQPPAATETRVQLGFEAFEQRSLPSAGVGLNGITHALISGSTLHSQDIQASSPVAGSPVINPRRSHTPQTVTQLGVSGDGLQIFNGGDGGECDSGSLVASLTGSSSGMTGELTALPSLSSGKFNIQVVVSGLAADTVYSIQIGGTSIGSVVTDSTGAANITFNNLTAAIASGPTANVVDTSGNTVLSGTFSAPTVSSSAWEFLRHDVITYHTQ